MALHGKLWYFCWKRGTFSLTPMLTSKASFLELLFDKYGSVDGGSDEWLVQTKQDTFASIISHPNSFARVLIMRNSATGNESKYCGVFLLIEKPTSGLFVEVLSVSCCSPLY